MNTLQANSELVKVLREVENQIEVPIRLEGELYKTLQNWLDTHLDALKGDVIAQINQTGEYDPDY